MPSVLDTPQQDILDAKPRKDKCMGTAIFNRQSSLFVGRWLRHGIPEYDEQTEVAVDCDDSPDGRTKRWDGDDGIRDATAQEIEDYDAEAKTAQADQLYDTNLMLKAFALAYAQREGLTPTQVRNAIMAQYENLVS